MSYRNNVKKIIDSFQSIKIDILSITPFLVDMIMMTFRLDSSQGLKIFYILLFNFTGRRVAIDGNFCYWPYSLSDNFV